MFVAHGRGVVACRMLGCHHPLARSRVCVSRRRDEIANGIDVLDVGAHVLVDQDEAALHAHADVFEAKTLADRRPADGNEKLVGVPGVRLALRVARRHAHTVAGVFDALEACRRVDLHLLAQRALDFLRNVSASSSGNTRSSSSMSVTLVPKRAYAEANSTPTAPAPRTTIDLGTCSSCNT